MEDRSILETVPQPQKVVVVLEVSPHESDHTTLVEIFSHSNWKLHISRTCAEAFAVLTRRLIPVVLCDQDLPDGCWRDVLDRTSRAANPPALIVTSRLADERLWSEVLNLGGYNVLSKPFRRDEVFRDVSLAWLEWKNREERLRQGREKPRVMGGAA